MYSTLLMTVNNNIAELMLNRPEHMNAVNDVMAAELAKVTTEIKERTDIKLVVLKGAGKLFMAGGDLKYFLQQEAALARNAKKILDDINNTIMQLQTMNKLVLASVHGSVAGFGLSLMLATDLVIAADNTKFTTAYSKIGLSPDGGATYFLPKLLGTKKALELLILGDVFDAKQVHAMGLINWICESEQLAAKTQQLINHLAAGPLLAYANTKALINTTQVDLGTQLQHEANAFIACAKSKDFKIGIEAFLQKKAANFCGE